MILSHTNICRRVATQKTPEFDMVDQSVHSGHQYLFTVCVCAINTGLRLVLFLRAGCAVASIFKSGDGAGFLKLQIREKRKGARGRRTEEGIINRDAGAEKALSRGLI